MKSATTLLIVTVVMAGIIVIYMLSQQQQQQQQNLAQIYGVEQLGLDIELESKGVGLFEPGGFVSNITKYLKYIVLI